MNSPRPPAGPFTGSGFWIWCVLVLGAGISFAIVLPNAWTISAAIVIAAAIAWLTYEQFRNGTRSH